MNIADKPDGPARSSPVLLRRHNLNLLPILRELLRTRSVARTAETVGLSQSAVSAALGHLRETYNDELLVMVGRHLELTEKGQQLIDQTERACLEVETLLRPSEFDPSQETRRFVVSAADYISYLLAPKLASAFASLAPGASVHFIEYSVDLQSQMTRGLVDVLTMPSSSAGAFRALAGSSLLFSDEVVVISSARHKTFDGVLTREVYETSHHAMFKLAGKNPGGSHEARILRRAGIEQRDLVLVDQFLTLPAIVEESSCLALVQRRLAERFQRNHDIEIHQAPFETTPIDITAYWSPSMERDPAHHWFRKQLSEAGAQL